MRNAEASLHEVLFKLPSEDEARTSGLVYFFSTLAGGGLILEFISMLVCQNLQLEPW